ncbi:T9SS type A sorting domain-containing protein [Marnyiella aurantia]|uniref:T9SS type A sorting domain-containing protein n=1 Tax=Marnyiella aurantia TaxID=2758037 RepID=A0A7D7QUK7_9FLAO|nr:T9SS type A sorting domain-containing protein [Marnyiella aurantia]MBA5247327.1 T9SS type A sorting domain-containing protein [Marnyiella aurantia]QMS99087.1 T9SS type A sorting domain-containing protein [Marnyiella aurantia]
MKKLFIILTIMLLSGVGLKAQNDCVTAVPIASLPFSSGTQTTCGKVNDYPAGSFCNASYGGGEDYVYSIAVTTAPVTLKFTMGGAATWKIVSVHSACPPTAANCLGSVASSTGVGEGFIHIPSNGTYYVYVDTWPAPACGEFTLDISVAPPAPNCATLAAPANGTVLTTNIPTLSWTPAAGGPVPTGYKVYLGTVNPPTTVAATVNFPATSYTPTVPLLYSTTYYWYVVPTEGGNDALGCNTTIWSFTTPAAPAAPANDNCTGAIMLTANAGSSCASAVAGTTLSATSSGVPLGTCTGTADDDVWYSFMATSATHNIVISNVASVGTTSSTSLYSQVFSGSCAGLTSLICDTSAATPTALVGLTIGTIYYVRVYNSNTGSTAYANTFNICVITPVVPPNDNCDAAVVLTPSASGTCATLTAGTTLGATSSGIAPAPCTGTADDDVWYSFVATNVTHLVNLSNVVSVGTGTNSTSLYLQAFSGACGTLTSILCDTSAASAAQLTGLTVGNTYYVRVYNSNGAGYANSFNICVTLPPSPPANDNCTSPVALTPGATFAQNALTTTSLGATTDGAPQSCQTSADNNVWYSVVVPASGSITIATGPVAGSPMTDTVLNVFSGTCGTLTPVTGGCNDDNLGDAFSTVNLTGQTAGSTLLISVLKWNGGSPQDGPFQISAYDGSLGTLDPAAEVKEVKVYPNPFTEFVHFADAKDLKSISVMDMSGRIVKTVSNPGRQISLGELKAGLYILKLDYKNGTSKSVKAIKK